MLTNAEKAYKMQGALIQLRAEYRGRPDVQHAVTEFLADIGPSQLALLYELVTRHDTPTAALATIDGNDPR